MGHTSAHDRLRRRVASPPTSLDQEIVYLLFTLIDSVKDNLVAAAAAVDLTMPQAHLLMNLDDPTPMGALAESVGYDASHITSLVDALEARALVERRPNPTDRRVKLIVLTEGGAAVRQKIEDRLFASIPPLSDLKRAERVQLRDLLAAATGRTPSSHA